MAHRKDNIHEAYEFLTTEFLDGNYRITDSEGHPLPLGEITALWNDAKIAKKFGVGQTTINYLRNDLGIPSYHQRKRIVDAMFNGNGENCPTVQKSPIETKKPKPTLPSWCKEGQWVMTGDGSIFKIDCVTGNLVSIRDPDGRYYCSNTPNSFKPVKFRAYTFEEAKKLLGKTMEYRDEGNAATHAILICRVTRSECYDKVYIHSCQPEDWQKMNATIDGVPIGMPEIDTEAEKEVEE